jgi:hypothetical protein
MSEYALMVSLARGSCANRDAQHARRKISLIMVSLFGPVLAENVGYRDPERYPAERVDDVCEHP